MGGTCNTHGEDVKCIQNCCQKTIKEMINGKHKGKEEDHIETDLRKLGSEQVDRTETHLEASSGTSDSIKAS